MSTKDRIIEFIEHKKISKTAFLNETKIKRGLLDKDKMQAGVTDAILAKILETYPEINIEWLIAGKGNMLKGNQLSDDMDILAIHESESIPVFTLDVVTNARHPLYFGKREKPETLRIPHMPPCDRALYIHTDTMYPIIKAGDIICYKFVNDVDKIYWGEMYVLDLDREENENYLTIRYIQKSTLGNEYICLHSYNPRYPPQDILKSNIRRMGLIKVCVRYNSLV